MQENLAFPVWEPSQAGGARRAAVDLAAKLEFDDTERGRVAVVAVEIANNLAKHAQGGMLLLRAFPTEQGEGVELLAIDRGPGMANVSRCFEDGYTTAGTPGTGLGAIARMSSFLDVYSLPGKGTVLLSRVMPGRAAREPAALDGFQVGVVCRPVEGEEVCGDSWAAGARGSGLRALIADGLGHGPSAAEASREAARLFRVEEEMALPELLEVQHGALRPTRGAAVGAAEIDPERQQVRFVGVGNISGTLVRPGGSSSMVSHNGTVGHQVRKIQEFTYPWSEGMLMVLHSDGLATQWKLDSYPGLIHRDPSVVAGVLYRDFTRGRDDVTVLVAGRAGKAQAWQSPF